MSGICWWFVDIISRVLEPNERDAVRGDFAESHATGGQALRDLLGLVLRRQIELWKGWRPWFALAGLIAPVDMMRGGFSSRWTQWVGLQFQAIWNHGVRYETGMTVTDDVVRLACGSLLLIAWAWSSGFVLGSLLRRTGWLYAAVFCLLWSVGRGVPQAFLLIPLRYALFWLTFQMALILMPCLLGVRVGVRLGALGIGRAVLLAAAIAALTIVVQVEDDREHLAFAVWSSGQVLNGQLVWTPRILPLATVAWQLGLVFVTETWRRRRGQIASN